jgi:hypothetical protein
LTLREYHFNYVTLIMVGMFKTFCVLDQTRM